MAYNADHDGKSDTASAVDADHYPQTGNGTHSHESDRPSEADIAQRAHQIWLEQGCPEGCAEQNWLDAERELRSAALSRRLLQTAHERSGSVQN